MDLGCLCVKTFTSDRGLPTLDSHGHDMNPGRHLQTYCGQNSSRYFLNINFSSSEVRVISIVLKSYWPRKHPKTALSFDLSIVWMVDSAIFKVPLVPTLATRGTGQTIVNHYKLLLTTNYKHVSFPTLLMMVNSQTFKNSPWSTWCLLYGSNFKTGRGVLKNLWGMVIHRVSCLRHAKTSVAIDCLSVYLYPMNSNVYPI